MDSIKISHVDLNLVENDLNVPNVKKKKNQIA